MSYGMRVQGANIDSFYSVIYEQTLAKEVGTATLNIPKDQVNLLSFAIPVICITRNDFNRLSNDKLRLPFCNVRFEETHNKIQYIVDKSTNCYGKLYILTNKYGLQGTYGVETPNLYITDNTSYLKRVYTGKMASGAYFHTMPEPFGNIHIYEHRFRCVGHNEQNPPVCFFSNANDAKPTVMFISYLVYEGDSEFTQYVIANNILDIHVFSNNANLHTYKNYGVRLQRNSKICYLSSDLGFNNVIFKSASAPTGSGEYKLADVDSELKNGRTYAYRPLYNIVRTNYNVTFDLNLGSKEITNVAVSVTNWQNFSGLITFKNNYYFGQFCVQIYNNHRFVSGRKFDVRDVPFTAHDTNAIHNWVLGVIRSEQQLTVIPHYDNRWRNQFLLIDITT